jgi:hypothetical protein
MLPHQDRRRLPITRLKTVEHFKMLPAGLPPSSRSPTASS